MRSPLFFFFLMIRRPPRSTLFPYTRSSDLELHLRVPEVVEEASTAAEHHRDDVERSEEHTSELQSQSNLVCRLLLEKKKRKRYRHRPYCALITGQRLDVAALSVPVAAQTPQ